MGKFFNAFVTLIFFLNSFNLIAQNSDNDSQPIQYKIGNSFVIKCATCHTEIGHIQYHRFENFTDSYFQLNKEAITNDGGNYFCSVCQTQLFKEHSMVMDNSRWNVFKQSTDENFTLNKVRASEWDSHVRQCIICQENEHYAPGLHFNMRSRNKKNYAH